MVTDPKLQQRIAQEQSNIQVASYDDAARDRSWSKRVHNMWGFATVGAGLGALVGLAAPAFPLLAGASLATVVPLIPASVAIFSATGMGAGFTAGIGFGMTHGAVAGVAEEQERRAKAAQIEHTLKAVPGAVIDHRIPEAKRSQSWGEWLKSMFNPRIGLAFAALGAVGGLIMAAGFIAMGGLSGGVSAAVPAMNALLGPLASHAGAVTAYFTGVMALFGGTFGINVPKLTQPASHFFRDLISGKSLGTEWEPQQAKAPQVSMSIKASAPQQDPAATARNNAPPLPDLKPGERYTSMQGIRKCDCYEELAIQIKENGRQPALKS